MQHIPTLLFVTVRIFRFSFLDNKLNISGFDWTITLFSFSVFQKRNSLLFFIKSYNLLLIFHDIFYNSIYFMMSTQALFFDILHMTTENIIHISIGNGNNFFQRYSTEQTLLMVYFQQELKRNSHSGFYILLNGMKTPKPICHSGDYAARPPLIQC